MVAAEAAVARILAQDNTQGSASTSVSSMAAIPSSTASAVITGGSIGESAATPSLVVVTTTKTVMVTQTHTVTVMPTL